MSEKSETITSLETITSFLKKASAEKEAPLKSAALEKVAPPKSASSEKVAPLKSATLEKVAPRNLARVEKMNFAAFKYPISVFEKSMSPHIKSAILVAAQELLLRLAKSTSAACSSSSEKGVSSAAEYRPTSISVALSFSPSLAAMQRFQATRLRLCSSSSLSSGCPYNVASRYHGLSSGGFSVFSVTANLQGVKF